MRKVLEIKNCKNVKKVKWIKSKKKAKNKEKELAKLAKKYKNCFQRIKNMKHIPRDYYMEFPHMIKNADATRELFSVS